MQLARLADLLTTLRIVSVPVMIVLVGTRRIDAAAVLLGLAWLSDFFDGRLARAASTPTRLNGWDLRVDAWLACGEGIGLGVAGYFSWFVLAPLVTVVAVGTATLRNPSPVMVGTGALSGLLLWTILFEATYWWMPIAYGLVLLVADWQRFWQVILPALWQGVVSIARLERHRERRMVLDEWAE